MKTVSMCVKEFQQFLNNKKCFCFGAGLQGLRTICLLENWKLADHILAFIDNDLKKQGSRIEYDHYSYPVISVADSIKMIKEDVVYIINCLDVKSVRAQLEEYSQLKETSCISLVEIANEELKISDYNAVVHEHDEPVIPKKLHYCWFGDEMPQHLKKNVESWKRICPDYEIIEWNDKNYDISPNKYMRHAFERRAWGYVSDYVRLDVVYQYGGIYIDTDVEIVKKLDDLLYQDCFASFDVSLIMALGTGFGAKPSCEIVKKLRDYYDEVDFYNANGEINRIPCNIHSYNVLKTEGFIANDTLQNVGGMNIYPMIFQGTNSLTRHKRITEKTYFAHYGESSWYDNKMLKMKRNLEEGYISKKEEGLERY